MNSRAGIDRGASIDKLSPRDNALDYPTTREKKLLSPISRKAQRTREMDELEGAVNALYFFFIDSSQAKFSRRSVKPRAMSFSHSISVIGDSLRKDVRETFTKIGLSGASTEGNEKFKSSGPNSLAYTVHYQLLKMPLELRPIVEEIQSRTRKYFNANKNAKSASIDRHGSNSEWQNLVISEDLKIFVAHVSKCLEETKGPFDVEKASGKLMNLPLETMGNVVRRRLNNPLPKYLTSRTPSHTKIQSDVCQALVENLRTDYVKCLVKMKLVDECLSAKLNASSSRDAGSSSIAKSSANLIRTAKSLDPTCTNARGKVGFLVKCTESQRTLKNNEVSYMTDLFLGELKKSPEIHRMANEIVSTVKKTQIGADATREIATLISVHQNAEKKLAKLSKASSGTNRNEISRRLADYERNLASMGLKTLKNVNEAVSDVEQVLVDSNQKVSSQDLSPNVKVIKCFNKWIESIFKGIWSFNEQDRGYRNDTDEPATPATSSSASRASVNLQNEIGEN